MHDNFWRTFHAPKVPSWQYFRDAQKVTKSSVANNFWIFHYFSFRSNRTEFHCGIIHSSMWTLTLENRWYTVNSAGNPAGRQEGTVRWLSTDNVFHDCSLMCTVRLVNPEWFSRVRWRILLIGQPRAVAAAGAGEEDRVTVVAPGNWV